MVIKYEEEINEAQLIQEMEKAMCSKPAIGSEGEVFISRDILLKANILIRYLLVKEAKKTKAIEMYKNYKNDKNKDEKKQENIERLCVNCRRMNLEDLYSKKACNECEISENLLMFIPRIEETDKKWIDCKEQLPNKYGLYQTTILRKSDKETWTQPLIADENGKWYWDENNHPVEEDFEVLAYCMMKEKYTKMI